MPKVVDHSAYRQELLNRCLALFASKSYGSLTMRQIAESLEVSTGTLYHYFPSKEELFEQLLEQVTAEHIEEAKAEILESKNVKERIEALFHHIDCHKEECQQETLIFLNHLLSQTSEEGKAPYAKAKDRYRQAGKEILQIDHPEIVNLLLCVIDGMTLGRIYDKKIDYQKIGAVFAEMVAVYLDYKQIEEEF